MHNWEQRQEIIKFAIISIILSIILYITFAYHHIYPKVRFTQILLYTNTALLSLKLEHERPYISLYLFIVLLADILTI
jgi:hypothetical protein